MNADAAEAEMTEGYRDGFNPDSPEPSANRSQSYRHGFRNGRTDRVGRSNGPAALLRQRAEHVIAADLGA